MKKVDSFIFISVFIVIALLIIPTTHQLFFGFTDTYPLIGGFIKFFIFASFGDCLSQRITAGNWRVKGLLYKAIVWGFIGIMIVWVFQIFTEGITHLQGIGLLPFKESLLMSALFISVFMNTIFAPTMMLFHRITDATIEGKIEDKTYQLKDTLHALDMSKFITFVIFKTIPLFWIPMHTITFLLDERYRVLFASLLGVALGLILGFAKRKE